MQFSKLCFDDIESIINDEDYNKVINDSIYIKELILKEIVHLKDLGVQISTHDVENDYIIVQNGDILKNIKHLNFDNYTITLCDKNGNTQDNIYTNNVDIKHAKARSLV